MKSIITLILIITYSSLLAQNSPVEYMELLGSNYNQISKDTWDYIKQASRGKNASKIEKRRLELASSLKTALLKVSGIRPYKGDTLLQPAAVEYLNMSYLVINSDYKKIVDLEKIAEESYDAMEAYLMTKDAVNSKMDSVYLIFNSAKSQFAKNNNINLIESESRLSKKLENASEVSKYYNKIYLIFFKSYWYEQQMISALSTQRVSDIEQYRQSLELYSSEGLNEIKSISSFRGDNSVKNACISVLKFFNNESVNHIPSLIDFYMIEENMNTINKNFKSKKQKSLTQENIDEYNKAVKDYNNAIDSFNKTNKFLNETRSQRINDFNKANKTFFNKQI